MRKNKFMRAASGLLVAVLLTTCVISGTFAKYTTTSTGEDSARVATWGFEDTSSITLNDLFKTTYDNDNVKGNDDVIAPGTTNSADFAFKYTGAEAAPEVAYTLTVDTTGSTCAQDIQDNKNIQWQLDDGTWGTWNQLIASIKALSGNESGTKQYAPSQLPEELTGSNGKLTHTVAWRWIFDDTKAETTTNTDTKDTEMGNAADLADVTLKITITATQVD